MGGVAKIRVSRTVEGLSVTVDAPELARFVHDYCKTQGQQYAPRAHDPNHNLGPTWEPCQAYGEGRAATALGYITRYRPTDGVLFLDQESEHVPNAANLWFLRSEAAAKGPVTYCFKGIYSAEAAEQYKEAAKKIIAVGYKELTAKYDKTVHITLEDANA
jgi:hypothetical protein